MFKKFLFLAFAICLTCSASSAMAQNNNAEKIEEAPKNVIYEVPKWETLSQLYWALGKFDPIKDIHLDNFLLINECDLYKDYSQNEFEWRGIREAAREFVTSNRQNFPLHFQFVQPIQFAEYDLDNNEFDVYEPNKIDAVRRFEVLSEDIFDDICETSYGRDLEGYPRGLLVELNRPFTLDKVPVDPKVARLFIERKQEDANKAGLPPKNKTDLYESRDAYLVMKMRIFSFKEDLRFREYKLSKVLGVLEGYEIYGDREREILMISENFRRKKERSSMEIEMKKRYQERLKKQMEEKRRKAAEQAADQEKEE